MSAPGVVVLAAGGSSRMGTVKQLLPYRGTTLLRHACLTVLETPFRPVIVVLGAESERCGAELHDLPVTRVYNPDWRQGMSGSLRLGLEALEAESPEMPGVLIFLHDQPLIPSSALVRLAQLCGQKTGFSTSRHPERSVAESKDDGILKHEFLQRPQIAATDYGDALGVPAIFDRSLFPELKALTGDEGARKIILRHAAQVVSMPLPEAGHDVDTPQDYSHLPPADSQMPNRSVPPIC
jgi:molybdenum cofactor cytidylyltransferase